MSFSMYDASIPVLTQMLGSLSSIVDKAAAHAEAKKIDPAALLQARLYPDMFPFLRQVQVATDFARGCAARLAGMEVPRYEESETTFAGLKERIERSLAFIGSVPRDAVEASAQRDIVSGSGATKREFKGQVYLLHYALPHFYFHTTTAYAILRHNGVEIGKKDFVGTY